MEKYIFVCIGTNQLVEDSFGPRVGEILEKQFKQSPYIRVLGTMKCPIHFQNAPIFLDYLRNQSSKLIVIDSAIGNKEVIGDTYMNRGGVEIGRAFGKNFYFPACWNIKTVIRERQKATSTQQINQMAQKLANQIIEMMREIV